VSGITHFVKPVSSLLSYNQQEVSDVAHCERQFHHIISYDQQEVSDIAHFVKDSLITSFPMTNRKWVTLLHIVWKLVSDHIFSCYQQEVNDTAYFVKSSLITSFPVSIGSEWHCTCCERWSHHIFPITHSESVTFHILQKAVQSSYHFLWPTDCEWHFTSCDRSHHRYNLFLWPTVCEWHCTFCEWQSHHIISYDQLQSVSNIAHFVNGSLITSFLMTKSMWVTLHI